MINVITAIGVAFIAAFQIQENRRLKKKEILERVMGKIEQWALDISTCELEPLPTSYDVNIEAIKSNTIYYYSRIFSRNELIRNIVRNNFKNDKNLLISIDNVIDNLTRVLYLKQIESEIYNPEAFGGTAKDIINSIKITDENKETLLLQYGHDLSYSVMVLLQNLSRLYSGL